MLDREGAAVGTDKREGVTSMLIMGEGVHRYRVAVGGNRMGGGIITIEEDERR